MTYAYVEGVRVVDLGLLCDPVFAHHGYAAINSYVLQQTIALSFMHSRTYYPETHCGD
jgi:hypothetical protein